MNYKVNIYSEGHIIVGVNQYPSEKIFILKSIKEDSYISICEKEVIRNQYAYKSLNKFNHLLNQYCLKVDSYEFYKIDDKYKYKVDYKLANKWIVSIFDKDLKRVLDFKNKDFKMIMNGNYTLKNSEKYQKTYEYNQKNIKVRDIKKWYYKTDRLICECLEEIFENNLYNDLDGMLRFKSEEYTEKERLFKEDLNNGFGMYYDGKYTFKEIVLIYIKMNYSVSGFMEVFSESLICEECENMSDEEIKKDIKDILELKKPSYDK
jgi:hypothetical protein